MSVPPEKKPSEKKYVRLELSEMRALIHDAVKRRRQAIVYGLAKKFYSNAATDPAFSSSATVGSGRWTRIQSLSALRAVVGGRFQNLKDRWLKAGFPLREHRGDRSGRAQLDSVGWGELALWINQQGFEVRANSGEGPWLFEVRPFEQDES